mmetsp:Transcript_20008/g.76657  ORF Transcript_20008/g.76657 Transcript_20008/m.76657 type:complete len:203 (-) Transcript_20008:588-1196(-)
MRQQSSGRLRSSGGEISVRDSRWRCTTISYMRSVSTVTTAASLVRQSRESSRKSAKFRPRSRSRPGLRGRVISRSSRRSLPSPPSSARAEMNSAPPLPRPQLRCTRARAPPPLPNPSSRPCPSTPSRPSPTGTAVTACLPCRTGCGTVTRSRATTSSAAASSARSGRASGGGRRSRARTRRSSRCWNRTSSVRRTAPSSGRS